MTPNRWKYIKALQPSAGRMVHVSAEARMIDVPIDLKDPEGPTKRIPWIQKPGNTFNEGRNKAKREART